MQPGIVFNQPGIHHRFMFRKFIQFIKEYLQAFWFITFPPREKPESKITLQHILEQFEQIPQQPTQKQNETKYIIGEQMVVFELEQLKMMPSRAFVGMTKILDEQEGPGVYKIRFVPCIVRPETLFLGFNKN